MSHVTALSYQPSQAFFWYDTNCKLQFVKKTEYNPIVDVIPKEGLDALFCYDEDLKGTTPGPNDKLLCAVIKLFYCCKCTCKSNTNPLPYIGMVPLICPFMTNKPHLSFSSNEPSQVNCCHMLTSSSARKVFYPKTYPFDL